MNWVSTSHRPCTLQNQKAFQA
ncbi:bacterial regulatory, arsR family protein, partial [Vibrio parahaemolyticus V-223/04]